MPASFLQKLCQMTTIREKVAAQASLRICKHRLHLLKWSQFKLWTPQCWILLLFVHNTGHLNSLEKLKLVREHVLPLCGMRGPSASCFAVAVAPTAHWQRAHLCHKRSHHKPSFSSYVNIWTVITELYKASLLFFIFPYCIFTSLLYLRSLHFSSIVCFKTFTFTSIYEELFTRTL